MFDGAIEVKKRTRDWNEIYALVVMRRVARGMQLLTSYYEGNNPDWQILIDRDKLDISHGQNCMLGQLFGDFFSGCDELGISIQRAAYYGFYEPRENKYHNAAWRYALSPTN